MKTAVSLPDPVFEAAEQLAKRLRMSRSELYATAIARFVGEHRGRGVTELLNRVYGDHPDDASVDSILAELQHRALAREES
jgi:metal-responsive CopG/Arc/MetJ family transcriptional regulator